MKVALEKLAAGADGKLVSQVARRRLAGASAAFRFSSVDGLLLIPPPPVESALLATGVSADGSTAVGWKRDAPSPGQYEAIRWRAAAGTIGLGVPFSRQIQIASDAVKNCVARLAGLEPPKWEDKEASLDELRARIRKTIDYAQSVPAMKIDGSEAREILLPLGPGRTLPFTGEVFLKHFALPNFFFHVTMTYAMLRQGGVELGKLDYLGAP